jgi:cytosine/adenosine deaminase-related metal-dependent hydrolase
MLEGLGHLAAQQQLHIHSHISESKEEVSDKDGGTG